MTPFGYHAGDLHLHFDRKTDDDDQVIFDLLEAEGLQFGSFLAYNEPAGPYRGTMESLASRQLRGLGKASIKQRGPTLIGSGQEYRSTVFGHLNLYGRDDLVLAGQSANADGLPLLGTIGRETRRQGGYAIYAHGGYAQAIYADFAQKNIDAVELLQFGEYRGIGLNDWYDMLNIGYRFPCVGASDYPACRTLGDCRTYVYLEHAAGYADWQKGAAEGRSFVTSGPLALLEVEGERPGALIRRAGTGPQTVQVRVCAACEVAPIQTVQIVVNGRIVHEESLPAGHTKADWIDVTWPVDLTRSSWLAARAFSKTPSGAPDAEAHTNPVYVYLGDKAPYDRDALDRLVARIDAQMAVHRRRPFSEKARVLDHFQKLRDILLRIRREGGLPAGGIPDAWIDAGDATVDASKRIIPDTDLEKFLQPIAGLTTADAPRPSRPWTGFGWSWWRPNRWCRARWPRLLTLTATCSSPRCAIIPTSPSPATSRWAACGCCAIATAMGASTRATFSPTSCFGPPALRRGRAACS